MGTQLPLPASWARHLSSMPNLRDLVDALEHAKFNAKTEIRKVLTRVIEEVEVDPREIDRGIDHTDDISDLVWEGENGYRHEIEDA